MKFFIVLILTLAVCGFVSAQDSPDNPGAWTPIQYNANNQTLSNLFDFGYEQAGLEANGDWILIQVNFLMFRESAGSTEMEYMFNCEVMDDHEGVCNVLFMVNVNSNGHMDLAGWQFV